MSTITPHYRSVQQLLQSRTFSIDEYQREYQWDRENIEELLSDLVEKFQTSYQPGHETSKVAGYEGYYLGAIIVSQREGKSYLVDGQRGPAEHKRRLATVSELMHSIWNPNRLREAAL